MEEAVRRLPWVVERLGRLVDKAPAVAAGVA
jgi:hypothetical protein